MDYLNEKDKISLQYLAQDDNWEIRLRVAEILINFDTEFSKEILISLTRDENNLVRASACDSLNVFPEREVVEILKEKFESDPDMLVRAYASLSLGDILKESGELASELAVIFSGALDNEESISMRIPIYRALYLCGEIEYLDKLLDGLNSAVYQDRIAVTGILEELCCDLNREKIVSSLETLLAEESSFAVISKIKQVLERIS